MTSITVLPIDKLHRRPDARPLNDDVVAALAESIEQVGLINPVRVRRMVDGNDHIDWNGGYEVIAGSHRFSACDLAGLREIPCIVVTDDDLFAELAMIDENLCRSELSPVDRAKQTARRKAIYLELHPETAHGANLEGAGVAKLASPETPAFATATATATGQSERKVQRDAERGEKVIDEVVNLIRGTKLDTGAYLDKIKGLSPNDQVQAARRDLARDPARGGIAGRYQAAPDAKPDPVKTAERFVALVDQIEALPVDDLVASGRMRAQVGQRASGLADHMNEIMERLNQ